MRSLVLASVALSACAEPRIIDVYAGASDMTVLDADFIGNCARPPALGECVETSDVGECTIASNAGTRWVRYGDVAATFDASRRAYLPVAPDGRELELRRGLEVAHVRIPSVTLAAPEVTATYRGNVHATWAPVAGATSYQVDSEGGFVGISCHVPADVTEFDVASSLQISVTAFALESETTTPVGTVRVWATTASNAVTPMGER